MNTEAEYTRPTPWCPNPERWHAIDGMSAETEVAALIGALVRALQPDLVVETGSWVGFTTAIIGRALADNGHGMCVALESDLVKAGQTRDAVQGLPAEVWLGSSLEYTPPGPVGFCFLDSDIAIRPDELERFWPHVTPGGIVAIHDTSPGHVTEWHLDRLRGFGQSLNLRTPRGLLLIQKPYQAYDYR